MKIQQRQNIKLLNFSTSILCASSGKKEYAFEGINDGAPVAYYFNWDEIEGINTRTTALKTGALVFEAADREEGYKALNHYDWKTTIIFEETIDEIINNPTIENLEKVLVIKDIHTIERFRGKMLSYINNGRGIDLRFIDIINGRFDEINRGILKSKILLKPNVDYSGVNNADMVELKARNNAMEQELSEMKTMMAELLKQQKSEVKKTVKDSESNKSNAD